MNIINNITPQYVEFMPNILQEGVIYISERFRLAIHLCACGCGKKTVTPLGSDDWTLIDNNGSITLKPSIGNFKGESPYHAHYYITDNRIEWL